jgi:hypothetical protein
VLREPPKYIEHDHFFFKADDELEDVCNAPKDKDGVFKVIELRNGKVTLVFLGFSKANGLYDEIVNGLHYDKNPRKLGWSYQLLKDRTDAIDIYWYVTPPTDIPKKVQTELIRGFFEDYGRLPKWNM